MFKSLKTLLSILLILGLAGCDTINESYTDGYSEDPNNPTDAPADKVFTAAQVGSIQFQEDHAARMASMWSQYFSGEDRQYLSIHNYNVSASDFDNMWFLAYVRGLTNLRIARDKAKEEAGKKNLIALTKIHEAMLMGKVTALWGDVPFSEAVKSDETVTPSYDGQSDVYSNVLTLLDEGISTLEGSSVPVPSDVTTLGGDVTKWVEVAYTLKARHLMHLGRHDDALQAANNGISQVDGSGDVKMPHGTNKGGDMNLWYDFTVNERGGYLKAIRSHSATMLENGSNGKTDEQDRYDYYYDTNDQGERILNNGSGKFAGVDQPYPLVTYGENELIKAEVHARKGNTQDAIDALNNVREYYNNKFGSGNYDDLNQADFQTGGIYEDTSLLQHTLNWTYLELIGQIEGFNFLRRTDYGVDGIAPANGNQFPQRYLYPQTELNTNKENVPDVNLFKTTPING